MLVHLRDILTVTETLSVPIATSMGRLQALRRPTQMDTVTLRLLTETGMETPSVPPQLMMMAVATSLRLIETVMVTQQDRPKVIQTVMVTHLPHILIHTEEPQALQEATQIVMVTHQRPLIIVMDKR